MKIISLILCCFSFLTTFSQAPSQYSSDFSYFCATIEANYCYWDKKQTGWEKVKSLYGPMTDTITSRNSFVLLLEKVFNELYDHHASLGTNTMESQRLVPSGADIWAEYINNKPIVTEVRRGFGADRAGIKPGMQILAFNDVAVEIAIQPFLPRSLKKNDPEARNYALRVLLAGKHSEDRRITVSYKGRQMEMLPDQPVNLLEKHKYTGAIESKRLSSNIGYIKINDRLWDNGLIPLFDSVLTAMQDTKALILDLRETPGGGNTTVARSIMGRFISKERAYQKHELTAEEKEFGVKRSWMEIVSPKKTTYAKPLVILVDHWTGSVGEGITIGFDGLKRATIIGTRMAGLNGAIYSFIMPATGIGFNFPAEKLFHVNGKAREDFKPAILVDIQKQKEREDLILDEGVKYLKNFTQRK
jgi:C-terminal processing protease CtpA/Prc